MSEIKIQVWSIDKLKPYELNAKVHNDDQVSRIAKSISEFGWDQPIVVDKNGVIIKGHGRRLAAIELGLENVPVLVRDDLTEDQVRAARLADNRVALGGIDAEILHLELSSLSFDLTDIFDAKELNFINTSDLSEVNLDSLVDDIASAALAEDEDSSRRIEETDNRKVRIEKALGFKEIHGKDERVLARFMAIAESESEMLGADAFIYMIDKSMRKGQ